MQLTKNFKLEELYASATATQNKIDNLPTPEAIVNLVRLADNVLQKIRDGLNMPVVISSGFRSMKLNKLIGGVSTSQHCTGQAADITVKGCTINQVFEWCKKNLVYDQLINEKNQWVHISYNHFGNRQESLIYDGKTYKKA